MIGDDVEVVPTSAKDLIACSRRGRCEPRTARGPVKGTARHEGAPFVKARLCAYGRLVTFTVTWAGALTCCTGQVGHGLMPMLTVELKL